MAAQGLLRLYATDRKPVSVAADVAPSHFQIVNEADLARLEGKMIAREPLAKDGSYKVTVDDRQQAYSGGYLVAVLEVPFLSPMQGPERNRPTMFVVMETFMPQWEQADNAMVSRRDFLIPSSFWCKLMQLFDVWCIHGRLVDCKTQRPLVGLTVTAMDADVIKDDRLGEDVTDADGYFAIWYRSIDFKKTFLSPLINVETPFGGELGPDVYFVITSEGTLVHAETRADGKAPGRKDRPNCWCVTLCIEAGQTGGNDDRDPIRAVWTNVGAYLIPDDSGLNDFDADGYGGAGKYGFFSALPLEGEIKRYSQAGRPMQWRFLTSKTTTPNGAVAPSTGFVPVNLANGTFNGFVVGKMIRPFSPSYKVVSISVTSADIDADGWVNLENAIARTFADDPAGVGISPANLASETWFFEGGDVMMSLNTGPLTTAHSVPAYAEAGTPVLPADYWDIERIAIRFECREVLGGGSFAPSLGNGRTLNSIVVSNDGIFAALEAKDGAGNTVYCSSFNSQPKLAFAVYHPHLASASLNLDKNGPGGYNADQSGGGIPLTNGGVRPGTTSVGGLITINPPVTETCIYIASLGYSLRLTTGRSNWTGGPTNAYFYFVA